MNAGTPRSPDPQTASDPQPVVSPIGTQCLRHPARPPHQKAPLPAYVVLTGNPNCGKTTLFNALTGLRAKVGNYAGVTVERKEGKLLGAPAAIGAIVLDLPGTYSLSPQSLDEQISRDVLLNRLPELPPPSLIMVVVDASNLQRNLYYATQVIELGYPTVIALNMVDVAENNGHHIDTAKLSAELGVPVLPVVASAGQGIPALRSHIIDSLSPSLHRATKHHRRINPGNSANSRPAGEGSRHARRLARPDLRGKADPGAGRSLSHPEQ